MGRALLTIAIPTFNRSAYLYRLVQSIVESIEFANAQDEVEVIIYDNHSDDDTAKISGHELIKRANITFVRNSQNIGSTKNIAQCYRLSQGDYTWVIGDDDVVTKHAVNQILNVIKDKTEKPGLIFLNSVALNDQPQPLRISPRGIVWLSSEGVIRQLHYRLTFLSAVILRKSNLLMTSLDENLTHLPHLACVTQIIKKYDRHCFIKDVLVRGQVDNSGEIDLSYGVRRPQPELTSIYVEDFFTEILKFPISPRTSSIVHKKLLFCYLIYRVATDELVTVNPDTFSRLDRYYGSKKYYLFIVKPLLNRIQSSFWKRMLLVISILHRIGDGDGVKLINRLLSDGMRVTKVRKEKHTSIRVDGNVFADIKFEESEVWKLGSTSEGNGFARGNIVWNADRGETTIGEAGLYFLIWQCMYTNSQGHHGEHGWRLLVNDNQVELLSSSWNGSGGSSATISTSCFAWLSKGDRLRISVGPAKGGTSCYCAPGHTFFTATKITTVE